MGQRRQRDNFQPNFASQVGLALTGLDEGFELNARPHLTREAVSWESCRHVVRGWI